jgi:hypothetical protein
MQIKSTYNHRANARQATGKPELGHHSIQPVQGLVDILPENNLVLHLELKLCTDNSIQKTQTSANKDPVDRATCSSDRYRSWEFACECSNQRVSFRAREPSRQVDSDHRTMKGDESQA